MDAQTLLQAYITAPGNQGDVYWERLSDVVTELVHKSVSKREVSDLDDFEEECVLAIWTKISALKNGESETSIDNIEAFIRRAVHNRYCDAIRRKRPAWYNLKLEILEICSGKSNIRGFDIWQNPDTGARLCGFSEWSGSSKQASAKCREILDDAIRFRTNHLANRDPQEVPTYELMGVILDYCGLPVDVDTITSCIAELTRVRKTEPLSIDAQPDSDDESGSPVDWLVSPDTEVEKQVVDAGWFSHVVTWFWREFVQLSVKQRKTLLYGMSADQVMALGTAVGLTEVADSLEMTRADLASLLDRLPLPDSVTAEELGVPARAIPSVRFKAWGRIRRRTRKSSLLLDEEEALT
jgi:DNA-directed RNA polymerase specialized sigma24 family protein